MSFIKKYKEKKEMALANAITINGKPDYDYYIMKKREAIIYSIIGMSLFFLLGFTFYRSIILSGIFSLMGLLVPDYMNGILIKRRKMQINLQFRDLLFSISSGLSAGKSLETAFKEAKNELNLLYPSDEYDIIQELKYIINGLEINETIENLLRNFAQRSHDEDIMNFTDVLVSCKRAGGNLIEVVRKTSDVISDKIEIKRTIQVSITEKKFEQKLMSIIILILILGLTYASGDYMDVMFTTITGRIVMTLALIIYIVSYFIGRRLTDFEV